MTFREDMAVNAIRILSADMVEHAGSGHPGMPLGAAGTAYELWAHEMKHNPGHPRWADRDRFVLSSGHGCALLYSLLHLFGYGLTAEDLTQFRKFGSLTPGHPEYGHTVGVEATTGPLGAGVAMAVGMAMAEAHLSAVFNRDGYPVVDHYTYALCGDGCMMEGISTEAFSLAGTLGLGKLIVLYDSNGITIEGSTDLAFTENVEEKMKALGFQTIMVEDGNDLEAIGKAVKAAKAHRERPSFITVKTKIGYGCPAKEGKASCHGEPLGAENVAAMRKNLGWPEAEPFKIPEEVYGWYKELAQKGAEKERRWNQMFEKYCEMYPDMAKLWEQYFGCGQAGALLEDKEFWAFEDKPNSTRNLSGIMINRLKEKLPNLIGGSADLAPSTKTCMKDAGDFSRENYKGRNIHFGIREGAMAAIGNGMALHGGLRPYVSTFLVFGDYLKPMARLSALMKLPVTYVLTHDSIGVGEDGPTHEPVEQVTMLRAMPGMMVFRPADAAETAAAWYYAVTAQAHPVAMALSRQNLPQISGTGKGALKGGYIVKDCEGMPEAIVMATGSELKLAVKAAEILRQEGRRVRVVSMPCMELFEQQDEEYRESVLPREIRARVAVEAQRGLEWGRYVGLDGICICMDGFGASGPAKTLFEHFGFTAERVAEAVRSVCN